MKELVSFSLKRRFINGATVLLNLLLFVGVGLGFHVDKVLDAINPKMFDQKVVYLNRLDPVIQEALLDVEQNNYQFIESDENAEDIIKREASAYVLEFNGVYQVFSEYAMEGSQRFMLENLLKQLHQYLALTSVVETTEQLDTIMNGVILENNVIKKSIDLSQDKQTLIFMVITSIYFTMLSFSTSVANEVIYEKSTKTLELILTSIQAKTHFLSKMLVGWLAIIVQFSCMAFDFIFWFTVRNYQDQGYGLIELVNKSGMFLCEERTFAGLFLLIDLQGSFLMKLLMIIAFLMMGILFIQMILVILSSFIANIEEAGNVQAPFYLILLAVYYFTLSVNTPYQMSEGIGFYLSFLPFFSMLFMPCRLMIQNVPLIEIMLSLMISFFAIFVVVSKGSHLYQRGVLDYSSKGFLGVMKSLWKDPTERKKNESKSNRKIFRNH